MYDTINIVHTLSQPPFQVQNRYKEAFEWMGFLWKPTVNKFGEPTRYIAKADNLQITMIGHDIRIVNSLQKFYMKNNYKNFSYSQVVDALHKLNDLLPFMNVFEAKVKKIAIGTVVEYSADEIIKSWSTYLGKPYFAMRSKSTVYGAKFDLTDYSIKGYDKAYEVKKHDREIINTALFRFEFEAKTKIYNNKTHNVGLYKVSDLIDKAKFDRLGNILLMKYKNIMKIPVIDYAKTTIKEKRLLASMLYLPIRDEIKKDHPDSYKSDLVKYKALESKLSDNSFQTKIEDLLNTQIQKNINT